MFHTRGRGRGYANSYGDQQLSFDGELQWSYEEGHQWSNSTHNNLDVNTYEQEVKRKES